ncbi:hypothetical protein BDV09DRAFT_166754 [Aspergillus tetrazonus]
MSIHIEVRRNCTSLRHFRCPQTYRMEWYLSIVITVGQVITIPKLLKGNTLAWRLHPRTVVKDIQEQVLLLSSTCTAL